MDASCFCCQFSLNTAGIIIGVYEIVQYTLLFFFALHFFKGKPVGDACRAALPLNRQLDTDTVRLTPLMTHIPTAITDDSDFLTIVTCCLCALIITSALLVYGSFKVSMEKRERLADLGWPCWERNKNLSQKFESQTKIVAINSCVATKNH